MAVFISFEGGEGSGKSTQAEILTERIRDTGLAVEFVHEPGSTELGWHVRDILKRGLPGELDISAEAELLLFSAARAELVLKALQPFLSQPNAVVIADRYVDSTSAYQGYGRGIPIEQVAVVNAFATNGVMPCLTFLLDLPPVNGLTRIGDLQLGFRLDDSILHADEGRAQEGARFEDEPLEFHERVRSGYLKLAENEPERFCVIDATLPECRVSELIWNEVYVRFPELVAVMEGVGK
jgi:dTMP kinase